MEEGCGEMRIKHQARAQVLPLKTNLRLKWCGRDILRVLLHPRSLGLSLALLLTLLSSQGPA